MQEKRAFFNPCEWRGLVYLCGCGSLEAFSPETETFLPFRLPLPTEEYVDCCVYVDRDVLVVHSYSHITKFRTGERGQPVQLSAPYSPYLDKRQNSQPVLDKTRQVCYLVYNGECKSFGMETGELIASLA